MILDRDDKVQEPSMTKDQEKKIYQRSLILFAVASVLSFVFAVGVEKKTVLFYILEFIYKVQVPDSVLISSGFICIVVIIILFELYDHFIRKVSIYRRKKWLRKHLAKLIFLATFMIHLLAKPIHTWYLGLQTGLDQVISINRLTGSYVYSSRQDGVSTDPLFACTLKNYGKETVRFSIKFVESKDPNIEYVIKSNEITNVFTIKPNEVFYFHSRVNDLIPSFIYNPDERNLPSCNLVIFNEEESKTYITY